MLAAYLFDLQSIYSIIPEHPGFSLTQDGVSINLSVLATIHHHSMGTSYNIVAAFIISISQVWSDDRSMFGEINLIMVADSIQSTSRLGGNPSSFKFKGE